MANDRAEAFARSLLGDILGCMSLCAEVNIQVPPEFEDDRCVPNDFYTKIVDFSKPFLSEIIDDINGLPVLLYASVDFFKRFAYSVCLKLGTGGDDEQVSFLKVTAFIVVLTSTSFLNRCFRPIDDILGIYTRMLKDHLSTKFYIEDRFDDLEQKLRNDKKWNSGTVNDMRRFIEEGHQVELAATRIIPDSFQDHNRALRILDVRRPSVQSDSDIVRCNYCGVDCVWFLKAFFQPRIKYKPECELSVT